MRRAGARRALGLLLVAIAAVALLGPAAAPSGAQQKRHPKTKKVTVADFYFSPTKVTIRKGDKVKWVWSPLNVNPHDVHLKKGPKKLKKKRSYSTKTTAVTGARFVKAFPQPGTYKFICTIHPTEMRMTVVVKK
ncbi:MAG: plastocyanin/azurin family copper-binding protein [Solirubrobacterales bacterium]